MNFEQNIAIMEAHQAESLEAFLKANPNSSSRLFERSFSFAYRSAWNACEQQQAEVIAKLQASRPRWIPVCERLPSLVNWYPCLNVDSTNWSREFFSVTDNCFKSDSGITITHWLELPELPE